jgi:hypothetical protein
MILKKGESIVEADEAMKAAQHEGRAKYAPFPLSMICLKKGSKLRFWRVDRGVLILQYSVETNLIEDIDYDLSDTYEHASSVKFTFKVESFDSENGLMRIQTNSPLEAYQLTDDEKKAYMERVMRRIKEMEAEQGTDEPATRSKSELEGSQKPQPESEGRSR